MSLRARSAFYDVLGHVVACPACGAREGRACTGLRGRTLRTGFVHYARRLARIGRVVLAPRSDCELVASVRYLRERRRRMN